MKSNVFTLLYFFLFSTFYLSSQIGVYDVTFVGLNTPTTVTPGDVLQVDIVQGGGLPNHGCVNIQSTVTYDINYYLVDQVTSTSYFMSSTNIWSVGINCASTNNQQWNNPGVQDVTVPCNLPIGDSFFKS